jgi:hypothetical protein
VREDNHVVSSRRLVVDLSWIYGSSGIAAMALIVEPHFLAP